MKALRGFSDNGSRARKKVDLSSDRPPQAGAANSLSVTQAAMATTQDSLATEAAPPNHGLEYVESGPCPYIYAHRSRGTQCLHTVTNALLQRPCTSQEIPVRFRRR